MKKWYLFLFLILTILTPRGLAFAATVGNPLDLDLPPRSAVLREDAVNRALDDSEQMFKIKAAVDLEFLFSKDLDTASEVDGAEIKGQYLMVKLGVDIFNRFEPYVKIGLSDLEAKWRQNDQSDIEMDADMALAWGVGLKGIIYEFENLGLRITADAQYRITEPDVGDISLDGRPITDSGPDFKIKEWQAALVLSKKLELPLKWQSMYLVTYTGFTVSDSTADLEFVDTQNPGADYSVFDASNDKIYGFLFGCDIMPSLTSSFIYNFELRLIDEVALSLGGAVKF
ncbi:MAG: hypothetical protein KJ902_00380 [Candidatus Omnitrophica bacterium]|nr:hypothetical protein [Candidatus Omnitrophota bacterium]MBU4457179.1 hypothetical protein [Candidatus Omnitrophota bacterium]